ncbi:MAG: 4'-phosphopantetheinyl transferase superfamily protein [Pseudomonadota bacterium]
MRYLGNDVVDLKDADNHRSAANPRFAARVLTASEREASGASLNPRWLWACWSAKEAAFKALGRHDEALPFIHRDFHVTLDAASRARLLDEKTGSVTGAVRHGQDELPATWEWTADWIHCVVGKAHSSHRVRHLPHPCATVPGTATQTSDASATVRELARTLLDQVGVHSVRIERQPAASGRLGPPCLTRGGVAVPECIISLSHDGRYVAAAVSASQAGLAA